MQSDDIRVSIARPRFEPDAFAENIKLLKPYLEIARRESCTMAQLALAWLLARDGGLIPIPGTKHIDWLEENAGAGDIRLSAESVAELDRLINHDTVVGDRYTAGLMRSVDSEND